MSTTELIHCIHHENDAQSSVAVAAFCGDINRSCPLHHVTPLVAAVYMSKVRTIQALGARGDVDPNQHDARGQLAVSVLQRLPVPTVPGLSGVRIARVLLASFPTLNVNAAQLHANRHGHCVTMFANALQDRDWPLIDLLIEHFVEPSELECLSLRRDRPLLAERIEQQGAWRASLRTVWMRACALCDSDSIVPVVARDTAAMEVLRVALASTGRVTGVDPGAPWQLQGEYGLVIALFL